MKFFVDICFALSLVPAAAMAAEKQSSEFQDPPRPPTQYYEFSEETFAEMRAAVLRKDGDYVESLFRKAIPIADSMDQIYADYKIALKDKAAGADRTIRTRAFALEAWHPKPSTRLRLEEIVRAEISNKRACNGVVLNPFLLRDIDPHLESSEPASSDWHLCGHYTLLKATTIHGPEQFIAAGSHLVDFYNYQTRKDVDDIYANRGDVAFADAVANRHNMTGRLLAIYIHQAKDFCRETKEPLYCLLRDRLENVRELARKNVRDVANGQLRKLRRQGVKLVPDALKVLTAELHSFIYDSYSKQVDAILKNLAAQEKARGAAESVTPVSASVTDSKVI